jgi:hypothetical protein
VHPQASAKLNRILLMDFVQSVLGVQGVNAFAL